MCRGETTFNPSFKLSFNPSFNPSFKLSFKPSFKLSFNPSFKLSFNQSFNPSSRTAVKVAVKLTNQKHLIFTSSRGVTGDLILPRAAPVHRGARGAPGTTGERVEPRGAPGSAWSPGDRWFGFNLIWINPHPALQTL
ncbi:hypothetical protein NHX12_020490 [Muraenolepis orangiensis]|uniref:Uncharacterized protein n=1 Tax=Muraenolepis orangiensis TaxID=630683 RepID=A0A9Q0ERV6_9TELE|nr:hypothetical protein NHX12_020490 [Muraenolepis orangiensis]